MSDPFADLADELLRAGLSPRRVRRYTRELTEHRQDLIDHLLAQGQSRQAAEREAMARLGSHDALLLPMLADPRFRSLAARWPALIYLALPLAAQALCALCLLLGLVAAAATPLRTLIADLGTGAAVLWLIAPVLTCWLLWHAARTRRASMRWPAAAALALSALAAATEIGVTAPAQGIAGEISLGVTQPSILPFLTLAILSLLPLCLERTSKFAR